MKLRKPNLSELSFRQALLADTQTMAYNARWGGAIDFSREKWESWYARWVECPDGTRFYRYLYVPERNAYVGEAAYHYDEQTQCWLADVLILAQERGNGYGRMGLRLLMEAAKENGVKTLCDCIAPDNQAALSLFHSEDFVDTEQTQMGILVKKKIG